MDIVLVGDSVVVNGESYRCGSIVGFPGYLVLDDGRVLGSRRSFERGEYWFFLSSVVTRHGYVDYLLTDCDGNRKHRYSHRLVAECFVPNPDGLPEVDHKDMNKLNNRCDNLEWVTHAQNQHRAKLANAWNRKLSPLDEMGILESYRTGSTQAALASKYSVSQTTISKVVRNSGASRAPDRISDEVVGQVRGLFMFGSKISEITKRFGLNYQTVNALVKNRRRKCAKFQAWLDSRA